VDGAAPLGGARTDVFQAARGQVVTFTYTGELPVIPGEPCGGDEDCDFAIDEGLAHRPRALPSWYVRSPDGRSSVDHHQGSLRLEVADVGRYRVAARVGNPDATDDREVWITRFVEVDSPRAFGERAVEALGEQAFPDFGEHAFMTTFAAQLRSHVVAMTPIVGGNALHIMSEHANPYRFDGAMEGTRYEVRGRRADAERIEWFVIPRARSGDPDTSETRRFGGRREDFDYRGRPMRGYRLDPSHRSLSLRFRAATPPPWLTVVARVQSLEWASLAPTGERTDLKFEQFFVDTESRGEVLDRRVDVARAATGGALVALRAVHIDRHTGAVTPLNLFAGRGAGGTFRVFDLSPGAARGDYGSTFLSLTDDYPEGWIHIVVPPNDVGVPAESRSISTTGRTAFASALVGDLSGFLAGA
jgi:hypothetical protein